MLKVFNTLEADIKRYRPIVVTMTRGVWILWNEMGVCVINYFSCSFFSVVLSSRKTTILQQFTIKHKKMAFFHLRRQSKGKFQQLLIRSSIFFNNFFLLL